MSFLRNIRLKVGLFFLRKAAGKTMRKKSVISYSALKSVILLFETDKPKVPIVVDHFTQALLNDHKKVYQVIYFTGDMAKIEFGPHEKRLIFNKKDLNFFFKPSKSTMEIFSSMNADYLIDLNLHDSFPLIYMAGTSKSMMRTGKQSEMRLPYFDLLISFQSEDQQKFAEHLLHYIKILIPQSHEQFS